MTGTPASTPRTLMSAKAVDQVVIEAMFAASHDKSVNVTRETELLEVVDSLGLMMGLTNIQAALNIRLEPRELIGALQARSIADLSLVLSTALAAR
jgi:acyl carrier protein